MMFYVGKWKLLPEEWEGINGLYEKDEEEIKAEVYREMEEWGRHHACEDDFIGAYTQEEFEETFNGDDEGALDGVTYWLKIF